MHYQYSANVDNICIFMCIFPMLNTASALGLWVGYLAENIEAEKFFNVKK